MVARCTLYLLLLISPILPEKRDAQLAAEGGRFVFGQVSEYRRDKFLLDTKTGRLWAIQLDKKDSSLLLVEVDYVHYERQGNTVFEVHSDLPAKPDTTYSAVGKLDSSGIVHWPR